jgi:hypothetical protein
VHASVSEIDVSPTYGSMGPGSLYSC